jgi:predicted nucleotidyltransferase
LILIRGGLFVGGTALEDIDHYLERFKNDLRNQSLTDSEIVDRHILFGTPYIFKDEEDKYFSLKSVIANQFGVSHTNVIMVGSAKLGFSIAPKKLWTKIHDDSDIDMVIISEQLFDHYWKQLLEFNINLTYRNEQEDKKYREFLEYFFKGWLRPDKFPFNFPDKQAWFDFFKSISYKEYDKRKITGAIYRNEYFFKKYHENNIKKLRIGGV